MSSAARDLVLTLVCPDRPGIVHDVSGSLVAQGGNIVESQQLSDPETGLFFLRVAVSVAEPREVSVVRAALEPVVRRHRMTVSLRAAATRCRVLVLVSRQLHCLNDLLFRASTGSLPVEVAGVASNHPDAARLCASYDVGFHHVPVPPDGKAEAEAALVRLVDELGVDLVVLARYMQVLSDGLCRRLEGRVINIHHSFLPSFKGAKPYHQAYERGVKLVGATAHYVTADLDEGPIIEQDVVRVDHSYTQADLVAAGRDVEAQVLARAVRWHADSRVLLNGGRTVVLR
ncbi:formyltetrahydrofolate deformylase [Marmoricola endophyticus]|uniref:Formyltetrahydrofolate deformylase n=1 Tax=Marmoricola endophyticus TaxID=2040280 RepID=A0A917BKZ7_9ACTN|nr:formyltetrahydrofolate deformylase [Marmoricola endophyticus]GGF44688.1 formyltetrahydrofolate deformylase [Marmoricola endophyticus]